MKNPKSIGKLIFHFPLTGRKWCALWVKGLLLLLILLTFTKPELYGQATLKDEADAPSVTYDEIPVRLMIEGYKMFYIDAIYGNKKLLFVNVEDLFNTLDIQCIPGKDGNSLSGFIEKESQIYTINLNTKEIKIGNKIIRTKNGLVKEQGALFMESSLFAEAFGITLTFNYRALTIQLRSNFELPILKQLRIEKLRKNVSKVKGEVLADTIVKRDYHLLKPGNMDYTVGSYQTWNGPANHQISLGLGAELFYGEADVTINYYTHYQFNNRNLFYLWRWVDNDKSIIKQAQLGKISTQTIAFIDAPIVGASIRNTPTTLRKAPGYYTIADHTGPNWNVELYINNVLVDFTKTDASGAYQFKVPIVYGYTTVKLKFYGPMGEERDLEKTMNVPSTMMPAGEFEYGLSGGVLQDTISSRFGRAEFNWGIARTLTFGGGLEYLSSITNSPYIPFATLTFQPFSKMTLIGEYDHGVKTRGVMDFYFRKDALLEFDYAKFVDGQQATLFNAPEERKVKLSVPFAVKNAIGFIRLDYTQLVYTAFSYNQGNLMLSACYRQFSANASNQFNWIGTLQPYMVTDLALSWRLKNGLTIRSSAQYNFTNSQLNTCKLALEKYIPKGNFSISYEKNFLYNDHFINVNFRYDLPGARTNLSVSQTRNTTMTSGNAQGSLAFGGGSGYVYASNNSSASKGGLLLCPFLDLNNNGKHNKGEPMVKLTNVSIMGGRVIFNEKDSIVRIPDLNAFTTYLLEFQDNDLEDIAWRFRKKIYQVLIDPNQFKWIDVPIVAVGEVSGMTYLNKENILKGQRRILVKFYKKNPGHGSSGTISEPDALTFARPSVAETLSESDGYLYYMGLAPGEYVARVDPEQLKNLNMTATPGQIPIKINQMAQGDVVSGLDFILNPVPELSTDSVKPNAPAERITDTPVKKSGSDQVVPVGKKDAFAPAEHNSSGGIIHCRLYRGEKCR